MSGKGSKTSAGSIAGAGWQSSCNCMKSHRSSGQAWRGYERTQDSLIGEMHYWNFVMVNVSTKM